MKIFKKRIIYTLLASAIVVFSTSFAVLMTLERMDYRNYLQGEYSKNMYDLITAVENIRTDLSKVAVTGSREGTMITFEEIFRYSTMANDKLNSLPIPQETVGETTKFLSQVGDFCYMQVRAVSEGRELTGEQYASVDKLKSESSNLQDKLNYLLNEINSGNVKWGNIRIKSSGVLAKEDNSSVKDQFKDIQKQVAQYPALIYDGPFSDNVMNIKPKVTSEKEVTLEDANKVLKLALPNYKDKNFKESNSKDRYGLKVFSYDYEQKNGGGEVSIDIVKNGGKVAYIINNRNVAKAKIQKDEAILSATKYLNSLGYKDMTPTYVLKYGNTLLVSMVYKVQDVLVYPDQIKVKIALDNGEIIGLEAQKYLFSHENREIKAPSIPLDEARKKVSSRLQIQSVKLTIIPTVTDKEALCYEFTGKYKDDTFLVYIDANTGYEQRILQIINTPDGELTI